MLKENKDFTRFPGPNKFSGFARFRNSMEKNGPAYPIAQMKLKQTENKRTVATVLIPSAAARNSRF